MAVGRNMNRQRRIIIKNKQDKREKRKKKNLAVTTCQPKQSDDLVFKEIVIVKIAWSSI